MKKIIFVITSIICAAPLSALPPHFDQTLAKIEEYNNLIASLQLNLRHDQEETPAYVEKNRYRRYIKHPVQKALKTRSYRRRLAEEKQSLLFQQKHIEQRKKMLNHFIIKRDALLQALPAESRAAAKIQRARREGDIYRHEEMSKHRQRVGTLSDQWNELKKEEKRVAKSTDPAAAQQLEAIIKQREEVEEKQAAAEKLPASIQRINAANVRYAERSKASKQPGGKQLPATSASPNTPRTSTHVHPKQSPWRPVIIGTTAIAGTTALIGGIARIIQLAQRYRHWHTDELNVLPKPTQLAVKAARTLGIYRYTPLLTAH